MIMYDGNDGDHDDNDNCDQDDDDDNDKCDDDDDNEDSRECPNTCLSVESTEPGMLRILRFMIIFAQ